MYKVIYSILLINNLISFLFGSASCTLLVWLILTKTSVALKKYSRILLQTCFIDLIFTIIVPLTDTTIVVEDGKGYVFTNGVIKFIGIHWRYLTVHVRMFVLIFSIYAMPIQHYYRYMVLCR